MTRRAALAVSIGLGLALAGCGPFVPAGAAPPELAPRFPTIVSLNPCSDAILAEVAEPAQLLAISHYSHDPRASSMDAALAARFRATGGTVEEIVALRPDVVVASSFLQPATGSALDRLGIPVVRLGIAGTVTDSEGQIRQLARLAGHPARGEALVQRIARALADAAPPPGVRPIPAIVWQGGGLVPGDASLIAQLMRHTGFANAAAARGLGQGAVLPLEAMLADPPQVIFAAGSPQAEEDRLLSHPALAGLKGTTHARFDPKLLFCGGPTIPRAVARLAEVRAEVSGGASTGSAQAEIGLDRNIETPLRLSLSKHVLSFAEGPHPAHPAHAR